MNDLTSAYGNGPSKLQSPIPEQAQSSETINPGKIEMPPMTIQAGPEPERQPATEATPEELAAQDIAAHSAQGGQSPEELAMADIAGHSSNSSEIQGPPEATGISANTLGAYNGGWLGGNTPVAAPQDKVVKMPSGSFGILQKSGQVRELSPNERASAHYIAKAFRIGGPTIGAILGELGFGIPGSMAGSEIGGEFAHPIASQLEQIAGEVPQERTMGTRAIETLAPAVLPVVGSSLMGSGIKNVGGSAIEAAAPAAVGAAGGNVIAKDAAERIAASKEADVPLFQHEVNPENPKITEGAQTVASGKSGEVEQGKLLGKQAERDQILIDKVAKLKSDIGPPTSAEQAKDFSGKNFFESLAQNHEQKISELKSKAYLASGNVRLPEASLHLDSSIADVLDKRGVEAPEGVKSLQSEIGAKGGRGITLKRLDQFVQQAQDNANFGGLDRSADNRVWGEIANRAREVRNQTLENVFKDIGDEGSYNAIKAERQFYSSKIDRIKQFQNQLEQDPSLIGTVRAIVKKNNPADIKDLIGLLPDEQAAQVKRLVADEILGEPTRGNIAQWAAQADKNLKSYDPKSLDPIFEGGTKEIQKLINVAKSVKNLKPEVVGDSAAMQEIVKLSLSTKHRFIKKLALKLINGLSTPPTAGEFIGESSVVSPIANEAATKSKLNLKDLVNKTSGAAVGAGVGAASDQR